TTTCLFFFSSRRRHTRFSRDWSSDVCSSDLSFPHVAVCVQKNHLVLTGSRFPLGQHNDNARRVSVVEKVVRQQDHAVDQVVIDRSEERRVGKECRSRGSGRRERNTWRRGR